MTVPMTAVFQSSLPRGERLFTDLHTKNLVFISILAPTRGATPGALVSATYLHISILAPTRGATLSNFFRFPFFQISILAPTRGATASSCASSCASPYFNPRSHEGSDISGRFAFTSAADFNPRSHEGSDERLPHTLRIIQISILAPTRGATPSGRQSDFGYKFQSSLPRGERRLRELEKEYTAIFQSSLPRGERLGDAPGTYVYQDFNPRSHEGSD